MRKIIHIDMDAFYASVEQRDNPDLRGKPVAVGGSSRRGVVAAASYEARKYGVRSAMPSMTAARLCPGLIFIKPRFDVYKKVSNQIRQIFFEYTDLVEPLSLDEAYLDVTTNNKQILSATLMAREIKNRIKKETQLTASAGISINKFLAKTASDINKPDGLFVIRPENALDFTSKLPIEKFFGIGKVTAQKMKDLGIYTGYELQQWSEVDLVKHFGKTGHFYYQIARAEDTREVNPHRIRKSLGAENTFPDDLTDREAVQHETRRITEKVSERMSRSGTKGKTLTLKVKYNDFQQITRSITINEWVEDLEKIQELSDLLISQIELRDGIRLLGITLSNLNHESEERGSISTGAQLTIRF